MVQKLHIDNQVAWLKSYGPSPRLRAAMNWVWNRIVGAWQVEPLRSPPRHAHEQGKQVELRRIRQLQECGVCVPDILGNSSNTLLLGDLGPSLSGQLKAAGDASQVDLLVDRAMTELLAAHREGAYFGQAFPRNLTVAGERIGFIDFEEDPLEVMSLRDAQARDWLLFSAGVGRHYLDREDMLASLLRTPLQQLPEIRTEVARVAARLAPLEKFLRHGRSPRAYATALRALRAACADC